METICGHPGEGTDNGAKPLPEPAKAAWVPTSSKEKPLAWQWKIYSYLEFYHGKECVLEQCSSL